MGKLFCFLLKPSGKIRDLSQSYIATLCVLALMILIPDMFASVLVTKPSAANPEYFLVNWQKFQNIWSYATIQYILSCLIILSIVTLLFRFILWIFGYANKYWLSFGMLVWSSLPMIFILPIDVLIATLTPMIMDYSDNFTAYTNLMYLINHGLFGLWSLTLLYACIADVAGFRHIKTFLCLSTVILCYAALHYYLVDDFLNWVLG